MLDSCGLGLTLRSVVGVCGLDENVKALDSKQRYVFSQGGHLVFLSGIYLLLCSFADDQLSSL